MDPKFSIIIPIHNSDKTVASSIEAALAQDFESFEVLLVNDGSTDKTETICYEYAKKDERIRYFSRPWGGVSMARNYGLTHAKGEYITFSDADDVLMPGALSAYWKMVQEGNYDIIKAGYEQIRDGKSHIVSIPKTIIVENGNTEAMLYNMDTYEYRGYLWNMAIRREIIDGISFDEGISWMEDHIFTWQCLERCKSMALIPNVVYSYIARKNGLVNSMIDSFLIMSASRKEYELKMNLVKNKNSELARRLDDLFMERLDAAIRKAYVRYDYPTRKELSQEMSEIDVRKTGNVKLFCSNLPFMAIDNLLKIRFSMRGDMQ